MADKEKILQKIRNLINLAGNNPSETEAQAAMLKAQQLMVKYRIEEGDLVDPESAKLVEVDTEITCTSRVDPWIAQLCKVVAQNYRCDSFMRQNKPSKQKRMIIVGLNEDPEIADAIFKFARSVIYHEIDAIRKRAKKDGLTTSFMRPITDSYAIGFVHGMKEKFDSQKEDHPEWALVVCTPKEVSDVINKLKTTPMDSKFQFSQKAYIIGKQDGLQFSPETTLSGAEGAPSEALPALSI